MDAAGADVSATRRLIVGGAGFAAIAVGGSVLTGWLLDEPRLGRLPPLWSMKPNTAACFLLAGFALLSLQHPATAPGRRLAARAAAAAVAVIAALTLGEHLLHRDLGLDRLLVRRVSQAGGPSLALRMSMMTAVALLLFGVALLALDARPRALHPALPPAFVGGLIGFLALDGYLYGAPALYAVAPFASIALHTAILCMVLSAGILCARPAIGVLELLSGRGLAGRFARRVLPLALALPLSEAALRRMLLNRVLLPPDFASALIATSMTLVFLLLLATSAVWLQRMESARSRAERESRADQERAEEVRQRMAALVESAEDAILSKGLDGNIRSWNPGAERLLGYRGEEIIGESIMRLLPEDRRDEETLILDRIRSGLPVSHFETVRQRKDGSLVDVSLTISPIRDRTGTIVGASKIMRDITDRREYLEQLRSLNAELELRILARTAELRERDAMLQEIHHRVKNNLQVISSLINMQMRTIEDAPTRAALSQCQSRVETMAQIHEMLYQAKDYAKIPFAKYAQSLTTRVLSASGLSPDEITLTFECETLSLAVDQAIPCALILNELVANALKHAFPNRARGAIRLELHKADGGQIVLIVADNGIGIAADLDFEKSSSLGVQLVATLVEQLGGRIEVIRQPGTTCRVTFPEGSPA